jgi:hypothetical protein
LGDLQQTKQNTFLLEQHLEKKNPKEETKLQNPEPPSPLKASPYHVTLRKQEGSSTARC